MSLQPLPLVLGDPSGGADSGHLASSMKMEPGSSRGLERGEVVDVCSLDEIRKTLDADGKLDGLPFMPEMERFTGRRMRVHRRADRICVEGAPTQRRLRDTVFLEDARCDGSGHGGCQRSCLLLWNEAWLRRPAPGAPPPPARVPLNVVPPPAPPKTDGERFSCQSTALLAASTELAAWRPEQYLRDLATGNLSVKELASTFYATAHHRVDARLTRTVRRQRSPRTPKGKLDLLPGEWVEVKSLEEIFATLNPANKNRGLEFSPGMDRYAGQRFRVSHRVERMIDEASGEMRKLTDTVVLENLNCDGACSRGCPRANPLYWREIWLKRVTP